MAYFQPRTSHTNTHLNIQHSHGGLKIGDGGGGGDGEEGGLGDGGLKNGGLGIAAV